MASELAAFQPGWWRRRRELLVQTLRLRRWARRPEYLPGHEVRLLQGAAELFPAMLVAISQAKANVWLACYLVHLEGAAADVLDALAAAAQRGVRVRMVVDGFGSHESLQALSERLLPAGVELVVFRPLLRWWHWLQPRQLRRLHQKLCVIDNRLAFVGGINLIDDWIDLSHGRLKAPRLDFAVALNGPVAKHVARTVAAIWHRADIGESWREQMVAWVRSRRRWHHLRQLFRRVRLPPGAQAVVASSHELRSLPALVAPPGVTLALAVRDNIRRRSSIELALIQAIDWADKRVDVVTPYFYPGRRLRQSLKRAAARGVRVRLLLQGQLDYQLAGLAAWVLYEELQTAGVEIHEYRAAFLHAKVAQVDGVWATVGSSNLDPLSILLNLEANVLVRDAGFALQLEARLEQALQGAEQVKTAPFSSGVMASAWRALVALAARTYIRIAGLSEPD